ncbi:centrosomal protein of 41 kDa-like isoform X2 [Babylonia areolata]|uniref:centrosomal protein of 41 kDa-like isoform X2 n=1 Tax=Babylonia areolata TaxID=304850 RepID=UPI003FD44B1F
MPKKGGSPAHNLSFSLTPRRDSRPRPRLFHEDRRSLRNILGWSVKDYKFRKNELFKRMKVTTFAQLIVQVADVEGMYDAQVASSNLRRIEEDDSGSVRPDTAAADLEVLQIQGDGEEGGRWPEGGEVGTTSRTDTTRSRLQEVICGVGEADTNNDGDNKPVSSSAECPYLLLDVRTKDDYDDCHVITALSYPTAMLARSVNYETKEMLQFKNQEGKIIIVYDNDETIVHKAATTLVERGYDNLFVLSGGLKVAHRVFPSGLITGTVPASLCEGSAGGGSGVRRTKPPSSQGAASAVPPPTAASKAQFTLEDLDCLIKHMDNALGDSSSSSRLSQHPRGRTSVMSTSSRSAGGRPPFKH